MEAKEHIEEEVVSIDSIEYMKRTTQISPETSETLMNRWGNEKRTTLKRDATGREQIETERSHKVEEAWCPRSRPMAWQHPPLSVVSALHASRPHQSSNAPLLRTGNTATMSSKLYRCVAS